MSLPKAAARFEDAATALPLAAMVVLALAELVTRRITGGSVPGAGPIVQHLVLFVGFLGAAVAAREGRLLALATGDLLPARWRPAATIAGAAFGAAVATLLARAGWDLMAIERANGGEIAVGIPVWAALAVLPFSFGLIALRLVWRATRGAAGRALAALGIVGGLLLGAHPAWIDGAPVLLGLGLVLAGTALGAPLFAGLGGAALWLFLADGTAMAAVPAETYRLAVSPTLPSIPLFTLAGCLLAEGKSALRLLAVFRATVGWLPGGTAVVVAALCAFFTTFTGGSGVTILALGALLYQALRAQGYGERFSLGLITSSGSLGLLFPPAVPLVFYGIVASIPIPDLFVGGILPGALAVAATAVWGIREGRRVEVEPPPFSWQRLGRAAWDAKWELALPGIVLAALFSGWATIVESSAVAALVAGWIVFAAHRDIPLSRAPKVLLDATLLIGGILVILGVANGLSSYLVDAQVPSRLLDWTQANLSSKYAFLLVLNLFLLVVGCLMDIFSAIAVVVPLIAPLGLAFGIDPVHLGIVFIANLELGFLTPPVGVNLFLASYRFDRPLFEITRAVLPWLALRAAIVLLITYVPLLTLAFLER